MEPLHLPKSDNPRLPDPPAPFRHYINAQTRFLDFDMLGHMNNSIYMTFFDMGKARYFEAITGQPLDWSNVGLVVVNVNCDFFHPVFFSDEILVCTQVERLGAKSMLLEQRIVNAKTLATHARCITTMATYDPKTIASIPLPTKWRNAVVNFEQRKL